MEVVSQCPCGRPQWIRVSLLTMRDPILTMRDPILVPATLRMPHNFDCTFWCLSDVSLHLTQDTSPG